MKRMILPLAAVIGLVAANAKGVTGVVTNGTTVVATVESGESLDYADPIGNGVTKFVKEGAGTLTVVGDNASFKGAVDVNAGILKVTHAYSLGQSDAANRATDGAITVKSGAQLYARLPRRGQTFEQISKRLVLAGHGPYAAEDKDNDRHYGALYAENYTDAAVYANPSYAQDGFIGHLELADDAVVGFGGSRVGLLTTDLKGHKVVIGNYASGGWLDFMLWGTKHLSGGTMEFWGKGVDSGGPMGLIVMGNFETSEDTVTLAFDDYALKLNNSIGTVEGQVAIETKNTNGDGKAVPILVGENLWTEKAGNVIKGGLTVGTKTEIKPSGTKPSSLKIEGPIVGTGALTVSKANLTLDLAGTGSTHSGAFNVADATVRLWQSGALADYSKLNLSAAGSRVDCLFDEGGSWTSSAFAAAGALVKTASADAQFAAVNAADATTTIADDFTGKSFFFGGVGVLNFTGAFGDDATTTFGLRTGELSVTGKKDRYVGDLRILGGTMTLDGVGLFYKGAKGTDESVPTVWSVGGSGVEQSAPATLVLTGETQFVAHPAKVYTQDSQPGGFHIGETASQGALVEIHPGVILTNSVRIAKNADEKGAVHQYGGDVFVCSHNNNNIYCGQEAGSYAYYGLYGGTLRYPIAFTFARSPGSVGVFEQTAGSFSSTVQGTYVGGGVGRADYYIAGGEVNVGAGDAKMTIGRAGTFNADPGAQAVLTLAGTNNPQLNLPTWGHVVLCDQTNDFMAVLNVNAGAVNLRDITRAKAPSVCQPGNKAYVNFGGGTFFLLNTDNPNMFGTGDTAVDKITLFPGGMTVDTNGRNLTQAADTPFTRPTGRGIASIALPADMPNGAYLGSPEVIITGGNGTGATAHALYDPATRSVTAIDVTCPGWDFTSAPEVKIPTADRKGFVTCTATLTPEGEEQPGGDFVKAGAATLYLKAANTYSGNTVLKGGTLNCQVANAIPAASTVVFAGGALNMNGAALPTKWGADCARVLADGKPAAYNYALAFPAGSTLAVLNADSIPESVTKLTLLTMTAGFTGSPEVIGYDKDVWRVRWVGSTLKMSRVSGMFFVVK